MGYRAAQETVSGNNNVAIGTEALFNNTTASNNTAVGYQAAYSNTTGTRGTFVGMGAGYTNSTASYNTAVGWYALRLNTTGNLNTVMGDGTLQTNTTGSQNTGIGQSALNNNTTGNFNTALGRQAGYSNTTGAGSVFVGRLAGYSSNATGDVRNTFIGHLSGYASTGTANTFIGAGPNGGSGETMTTGSKNTIVGAYNGNQGGLDIRTSSNNIVLSDGDGNPRVWVKNGYFKSSNSNSFNQSIYNRHEINQSASGEDTLVIVSSATTAPYGAWIRFSGGSPNDTLRYFLNCQDSTTNRLFIYSNGNVVNSNNSYGAISDVKLKENIVDSGSQWDDIKALTVRKYSMKSDNLDAPNRLGVIAQEVEAAGMNGLVFESPDLDPETKEDLGTVTKQVNYSILYMKAVKALQEAMDRIETLEAKVTALENA